jgi:hypothetical protein
MTTEFTFTEEHDELRATIRAFLAEHSDELPCARRWRASAATTPRSGRCSPSSSVWSG